MNRAAFEASLRRDGYEIMARDWAADTVNPAHTHDFDARLFVTAGDVTMTIDGERRTYGVGESWAVPAGTLHAEACGPNGVSLIIGRRSPGA